jgi:hypothetical protein
LASTNRCPGTNAVISAPCEKIGSSIEGTSLWAARVPRGRTEHVRGCSSKAIARRNLRAITAVDARSSLSVFQLRGPLPVATSWTRRSPCQHVQRSVPRVVPQSAKQAANVNRVRARPGQRTTEALWCRSPAPGSAEEARSDP